MFLYFVKLGVKPVCPLSLSFDCFRAGSSRVPRQARLSTRKGPLVFTSLNAGDGVDGGEGPLDRRRKRDEFAFIS